MAYEKQKWIQELQLAMTEAETRLMNKKKSYMESNRNEIKEQKLRLEQKRLDAEKRT